MSVGVRWRVKKLSQSTPAAGSKPRVKLVSSWKASPSSIKKVRKGASGRESGYGKGSQVGKVWAGRLQVAAPSMAAPGVTLEGLGKVKLGI